MLGKFKRWLLLRLTNRSLSSVASCTKTPLISAEIFGYGTTNAISSNAILCCNRLRNLVFHTLITYRYAFFISTSKNHSILPPFFTKEKIVNEVIVKPTEMARGHFHARTINTSGLPQNLTNASIHLSTIAYGARNYLKKNY